MPRFDRIFSKIIHNLTKLQAALNAKPTVINQQDEEGQTLLHHLVNVSI